MNKDSSTGGLLALILVAALAACDSGSSVNHRNSRAQFGQDGNVVAPNALGESVALAQFSDKYVWVDYAAEWCSSCQPQSNTIRSLASTAPEKVVFVTVMTSEREGYGHPATRETAARWAKRLSLNPKLVVAADLTSLQLPQHALFSPDGKEIYRHIGKMSAAEIRQVLAAEDRGL
jgi:thiol-disulfide isomerase/thioredoxin